MSSALRRLFDEIVAEAERRPDFASRIAAALAESQPAATATAHPKRKGRNKRAPAILDPFDLFTKGEQSMREALQALQVDQLKDIVSQHAMDSSKLALKWRSRERLVDLIISMVRMRTEKGDAFKRNFVAPRQN
jgi:hypothetical protein